VIDNPRVAFLTCHSAAGAGGEEAFTRELSAGLRQRGMDVTIIDPEISGYRATSASRLADRLHRLPDMRRAWFVAKEFKRWADSFDVVAVNSPAGWAVPGWPGISIYNGARVGYAVAAQRSLTWPFPYLKTRLVVSWFERSSGKGRTVIAVSRDTSEDIERFYGLRVARVIYNGRDLNVFRPRPSPELSRRRFNLPESATLALFTGRPGRHKGTDILDQVADALPEDIRVVAAVPKDYVSHPRILKLVNLPRNQLPELYSCCDAFVFPSRWEGCSLSLIEALASGLPPVASRVGHMPEVAAEEPLLDAVAPRGLHPGEFVRQLVLLKAQSEFKVRVSKRARAYAMTHHSIDRMIDSYAEQLRAAAESKWRVGGVGDATRRASKQ